MQRHKRLVGAPATGSQPPQQPQLQQPQQPQQPIFAGSPNARHFYSDYPPFESPKEKAVKYMMLIHEVFVMMIAGVVVLGLGAYTATQTSIVNSVCDILGVYYHVASYALMIITGCTMVVASVIGLVGTVRNSACLHLFYLIVMVCLLVTFIVVGSFGFAFYTDLQDAVKTKMEFSMAKYYGISLTADRNKLVTDATDAVQIYFSCCGAYGGINSTHSWYLYQNASAWYQVETVSKGSRAPYVPQSCCLRRSADSSIQKEDVCVGQAPTATGSSPPINPPPVANANAFLFTTGCFDAMQTYVMARVQVAASVGIAYFLLLIIGIVLGFMFARFIAVANFYGSKYANLGGGGSGGLAASGSGRGASSSSPTSA